MNKYLRNLVLVSASILALACTEENQPPDDAGDGETGDGDGDGDGDGEQCVTEPSTPIELLNGCTDATCEPFANTPQRLPLLNADGSLPPLP